MERLSRLVICFNLYIFFFCMKNNHQSIFQFNTNSSYSCLNNTFLKDALKMVMVIYFQEFASVKIQMFHTTTILYRNWMLTAYIYQRQKERCAINMLIQKEYRFERFLYGQLYSNSYPNIP